MSASYLWRRVLFRTHWIAGLLAGLVLSAVGVTGAVLAFEDEILVALNPQLAIVPEGEPRSPDALIAAVRERHPDRGIAGFAWRGATRAADVRFDGGFDAGSVAIDPYRGTLLPAARGADAIHAIEQVHRNLAAGPVGKQLVGASTVVLVLLAITGIWLRWPKRWTSPRAWLALDWSLRGRAFLWHLHSVVATWVLPLYLVAALTGLFWSYESYRAALFALAGVEAPAGRGGPGGPRGPGAPPPPPAIPVSLDASWRTLRSAAPRLETAMVGFPRAADAPLEWRYVTGDAPHERASSTLRTTIDGAALADERYERLPAGRRAMAAIFPLHSGAIVGAPGRALMAIASLLMPLFFVTGVWLWLARRNADRRREVRRRWNALANENGSQ